MCFRNRSSWFDIGIFVSIVKSICQASSRQSYHSQLLCLFFYSNNICIGLYVTTIIACCCCSFKHQTEKSKSFELLFLSRLAHASIYRIDLFFCSSFLSNIFTYSAFFFFHFSVNELCRSCSLLFENKIRVYLFNCLCLPHYESSKYVTSFTF